MAITARPRIGVMRPGPMPKPSGVVTLFEMSLRRVR